MCRRFSTRYLLALAGHALSDVMRYDGDACIGNSDGCRIVVSPSRLVRVFMSVRHRESMAAVGHRQGLDCFGQKVLIESSGRDGKPKLNTKWNSTEPKRSGTDSERKGKENLKARVRHQLLWMATDTLDQAKAALPFTQSRRATLTSAAKASSTE